jgi:hypothetical protein
MKLEQVLKAANYTVAGGSEYGWKCWADARFIDFESEFAHASAIYSAANQTIYQFEVCAKEDDSGKTAYRWMNPEFKQAYLDEAKLRNCDPDQAWDDVKWNDTDTEDDILEKVNAIMEGREFDSRTTIAIDFTDEELLTYMKLAHELDITFNSFVEMALVEAIKKYENDPN